MLYNDEKDTVMNREISERQIIYERPYGFWLEKPHPVYYLNH